MDAVNEVVSDLHKNNDDFKKITKNDLISKLIEHESETFHAATDSQTEEMLSDKAIVDILADVSANRTKSSVSRAAEIRLARRGLLLMRREVFYEAMQSGYSAEEARAIAEKAVKQAEEKTVERSLQQKTTRLEETKKKAEHEDKQIADEQKFYDFAFQMAEKMLAAKERSLSPHQIRRQVVHPDQTVENIFTEGPTLNIFNKETFDESKEHSLEYWASWDTKAAQTWNQSFGPKNGFEEMIELTKKGKMWPYPIDNEYMLGEEENVPFHEHIFLERTLSQYNLPKTGSIAHFMELVCVGLSKNPYMTAKKKRSHIEWFANYFNEKKVTEIEEMHRKEEASASS